MSNLLEIVSNIPVFKDKSIKVNSIYKEDLREKCFLITDSSSNEKYKVRIVTEDYPVTVEREYNALKFLNDNFSFYWIPKIHYAKVDVKTSGDVMVYDYFDGVSIDKLEEISQKDCNNIIDSLSGILSKLHSIKSKTVHDFLGCEYDSWHTMLKTKFEGHINEAIRIQLLNNFQKEALLKFFEKSSAYFENINSSFVHFDIKPANIVYDVYTNRTYLIDYELSRFGDAMFDFIKSHIISKNFPDFYNRILVPLVKIQLNTNMKTLLSCEFSKIYKLYHLLACFNFHYNSYGKKRTEDLEEITSILKEIT